MRTPQPLLTPDAAAAPARDHANAPPLRLVLLPGLAADARLFEPQRAAFPTMLVPPWITPHLRETLPEYASRFAATLDTSFDTSGPYVLGGVSFGAQVALEVAATLPPERRPHAVAVISGVRSHRGISARFRRQQALGSALPDALVRAILRGPGAARFARREGLAPDHAALLSDMARDADLAFLRWAARTAARWAFDGALPERGATPPRVFQIHGRHDRVIPFTPEPTLPGEVTLLDRGRHLINLAAAGEVNQWLAHVLTSAHRA